MKSTDMRVDHRRVSEKGQTAALFALLIPVIIGVIGLVVDGGYMFVQYRRAQVTVDSAAYAAATVLDEDEFRLTNQVRLDPNRACAVAQEFAATNSGGEFGVSCVLDRNQVNISSSIVVRTIFMSLLGVKSVPFHLRARAELKYGITEEGQ